MGKLLQTLDDLQMQDGHPDIEGRRIELDSLVRHLTVTEIRRLRMQLNAVTIPNDICVEFPTELLLCIAEHLELEEVIRARAVSKTWNRKFSSADFCIGIIKTHFRTVWEMRYRRLSADQQIIQREVLRQWLSGAAKERIRRRRGRYRLMSIYRQTGDDLEDWQYKNGRIAFRRDSSAFIVRDLRTGSTVTYMDENRINLGSWLLSEDFLIVVKNGPISLRAWPLISPQTAHHSVRLPGPVLRITAHQSRVGVVTAGYQILIWYIEPGGLLESVDDPGLHDHLTESRSTQILVAFHPLEQDCFFVVYEARVLNQTHTRRFVVQEFTKRNLTATKSLDLDSFGFQSLPIVGLLHDGVVGISKVFVERQSTGIESKTASESRNGFHREEKGHSKAVTMATFNIYQRRFVLEDYYLPDSIQEVHRLDEVLEQAFYWRRQILLPVVYRTAMEIEHMPRTGPLLIAINQHRGLTSPRKIPWYKPEDNESYLVQEEKPTDTAYYWLGSGDFARDAAIGNNYHGLNRARTRCYVVQGDDDFVILLARDGWVVWRFDSGVMNSASDLNLPPGTQQLTP